MEQIGRAFEWLGVAFIVATTLVTIWVVVTSYRANGASAAFTAGKRTFGLGLLASLEVFVAADLIETVSVELTLEAVAALGLLVVVRTILSFSIDVEINGILPWRARAADDRRRSDEPVL